MKTKLLLKKCSNALLILLTQAKSKESASNAQDNDTLVINIKRQHLDSNAQQVTAPTQKAGFRASQTHLCKPKIQFSE